jgi:ADP-heptose:LPS heptosyltransferase
MKRFFLLAENKYKVTKKIRSIKDYYLTRNKILIIRECGGVGDILTHRMIFEDFHRVMPDIELTVACPKKYHILLEDHPYIHHLIDSTERIDRKKYMVIYNTSSACREYEMKKIPFIDKNRSDIWAEHCGVILQNHNMHLKINQNYIDQAKKILQEKNVNNLPTVMIAPYSTMKNKDMTEQALSELIEKLKIKNLFPFILHNKDITYDVCSFVNVNLELYLGFTAAADYVISVDTGQFHLAAGLNKPLVGIFTNFDGKIYGKYYKFNLVQMHRDNKNWDCGPCHYFPACPKSKTAQKPCCTLITADMIMSRFDDIFNSHIIHHSVI